MSTSITDDSAGSMVDFKKEDEALPPIDRGRRAWLFLFGAFMIEGLLYGFPLTFGVFQEYYEEDPRFDRSPYLPVIGTLAIGVSKLGAPLITPFIIKHENYRKHMIWTGSIVCVAAVFGSSFSTELWHLIVSQGFLYSVGFLILYYPLLSMLNEWFLERRGFAYGILFGSGGLFGLALPLIMDKLLSRFGYAITLRAYAIAIIVLVGPCLPLLRGRLPPRPIAASGAKIDTAVFSKVTFSAITFSNIFQGLPFFLPNMFIPAYAAAIGLTPSQGTVIISATNVATIVSQIGMGIFCDRYDAHLLMFLSCLLSSITVLLLWGFSASFSALLFFGILYGLFAGGYSVLFSRFGTALTKEPATQVWLYSIFESQRGVAIVVGGLVSGSLVTGMVDLKSYGIGSYQPLILLVGSSLLVGCMGGVGWFLRGKIFKFACPVRITSSLDLKG